MSTITIVLECHLLLPICTVKFITKAQARDYHVRCKHDRNFNLENWTDWKKIVNLNQNGGMFELVFPCSLFLTFVSHTCDKKFSLFTERIIEDHEKLISVMMNWLKISNNKILFLETDDKYDLFFQPQVITLQWIQTVTLWGEDKSTGEDHWVTCTYWQQVAS